MKVGNSVRYAGAAAAVAGLAALGLVAIAGPSALAQTPPPLKIGVMDGFSGVYGDLTAGEVEAMQMAIEDVGGKVLGRSVEILSADHQTKPDVGAAIARKWYDVDGVKMITGLGTSSVALAVRKISQEKGQIDINTGAASSDLTGPACSETGAHWVYDTYSLAHVTGSAMVKAGGDSWYFLTADYAFGHALERDVSEVVKQSGGKVLGAVRHPLNTSDFSSFLLQAQASKAKVVGLANAGGDTTNSIKQASEFGIVAGGQKLAALLLFITDVHSLGLKTAQGLTFTESFYWDLNEKTREWSKRFEKASPKGTMPSMTVAGNYAAVLHYLKALEALGGNPHDGAKVVAKMKEIPTDDPLFGKGPLRIDGRRIIPAYLFEVKKPEESKYPWDYYKLIATIPPEDAAKPLEASECPLVKK
jgi:branched-chain amino acid transport system substrate-binding protein